MSDVLHKIIRLPRFVKVLATNKIDSQNAVVLNDGRYDRYKEYYRSYYKSHREIILEKKKIYNQQPHVKQHNAERHHNWYLEHKEELNHKRKSKSKITENQSLTS